MAPPPVTEVVRLRDDDGAILTVERAVVPGGYPLLVHSGSPGSRRLWTRHVERAAEAGFSLLSYDRPGYGGSSPRSDRVIANAADDVAVIADAFGYSGLAVWGFSGGGPFALAAAARLPGLVGACCVIASLAPRDAIGGAWAEAWSADSQAQVELFFTDRVRARELFRAEAAEMFSRLASPEGWLDGWGREADQDEAHSREMATYLAAVIADASAQGDLGWWDDWAALLSPWGFDVASIAIPVQLWHGENDAAAPLAHGRWLAEHIPKVEANFVPGANHTDIETIALPGAYRWLSERVRRGANWTSPHPPHDRTEPA
ncbi:MAG: alpha/beta fold hydrolase [Acidimicrobiales bacterium]|jgi:pimeloyl-ACP methyl ester carboxylesterase